MMKNENLFEKILKEFVLQSGWCKGRRAKRVYTGYLKKKWMRKTYTGLEERETLIRCGTVFFVNPQEFGARLPWFLGLLKLEFHLDSTKNTSADLTFVS